MMANEGVFGGGIQPSVLTGSMIAEGYNSRLEYDPRLPLKAGEMKRRLEEIKADGMAVVDALRNDFSDAFTEVQKQIQRVGRVRSFVEASFSGSVELAKDPAAMRAARKAHAEDDNGLANELAKLGRLERERDRLQGRMAQSFDVIHPIGRLLNSIEHYLDESRGRLTDGPKVLLSKSDTVETVEAKIVALRADLNEVEKSPWPSSDAKARAAAEIDFIASHGEISVAGMIEHRGSLEWPGLSITVAMGAPGLDGRANPYDRKEIGADTALTTWLFKDVILQRLHDKIDQFADDDRALSAEVRAERTAAIKTSILAQERILSGIIWRDGLHNLWPADIDPRAALGFDGPDVDRLWS